MTSVAHARQAVAAAHVLETNPSRTTLTDDQRATLADWPGWGPLSGLFESGLSGTLAGLAEELESALGADAFAAGRAQCDNSFYTSEQVVSQMWKLLAGSGFTGGRVLDLGAGSGNFARFCPDDLDVDLHGIEIDPTSARIASLLNPGAQITNKRLQDVAITPGSFDVAIGNVPFGSVSVYDSRFSSGSLHGYFLKRAVDAVRPGGFVLLVTSRFHMDSERGLASVSGKARFVGAVRLPSKTFAASGTDVVADVVMLQVRHPLGETTDLPPTPLVELPGQDAGGAVISRYFYSHPERVAGVMRATGNWRNSLAVDAADPAAAIADAFTDLAQAVPSYKDAGTPQVDDADLMCDVHGRPEGTFELVDGQVHQVTGGVLSPSTKKNSKELIALVALRDAVAELLEAEGDWSTPDAVLDPLRAAALEQYTAYVDRFGPLNRATAYDGPVNPATGLPTQRWRRPPMAGFRADPSADTVFGIEVYDNATGQAAPAPILLRRTNHRPEPVTRVDSAPEAVAVCLSRHGELREHVIASLLDIDPDTVDEALGEHAFREPIRGQLVAADEYLSGNIADKLDQARQAARFEPEFARNVGALEAALPAPLGPDDISVSLGAPWLTGDDVAAFLKEILGASYARVTHTPEVGAWDVDTGFFRREAEAKYGTSRMSIHDLVTAGLNGGVPVVYDTQEGPDGTERRVRNAAETALAGDKLAAINAEFSVWLWSDPKRSDRLVAEYNRRFNSVVPRRADGSYLQFANMAPGMKLWPHQLRGVDHALRSKHRAVFIGHAVGAGKTLTAIATAIKMREYGLANKPCITTPAAVLEQFAREARQAFPTAKILVATKEQVAGPAKRRFVARAAAGDWDAVIMSHETFTSLGVDPVTELAFLREELAAIEQASSNGNRGARALAGRQRSLENRIDKIKNSRHDRKSLMLAHTGVDWIGVDEGQFFKAQHVATRTAGLSMPHSQRAIDLMMKIHGLAAKNPGRPVAALFSGTPLSNSLTELYCWTKLCAPELLDSAHCAAFDAWAATFVSFESVIETSPDGGNLRVNTRPVKILNAPEARTMFQSYADLVPPSELDIERPDVDRDVLVAQPNAAQIEHMGTLAKRIDALRTTGFNTEKGADNMLSICNDGRLVALDPRLVGVDAESPKLELAAAQIAQVWRDTRDTVYDGHDTPGGFQLVCMDQGTPGDDGDDRSYGRLRDLLISHGMPADRIRYIHEAPNAKAREALFAQCRDGAVSVLIGSSALCGVGVNIQRRLAALFHIDSPWTPSTKAQREGRAIRPGNLNPTVRIIDVVTEGTFDGLVNAAVARKRQMVDQMFTNAPINREIVDLSDEALSLAEVSAAATGHPELIEQAELAAELHKLKVARSSHLAQVKRTRIDSEYAQANADRASLLADRLEAMCAHSSPDERTLTLSQAVDAADALYRKGGWHRIDSLALSRKSHWIDVHFNRREVDSLPLPAGSQRPRSKAALADWLVLAMQEWNDGLPDQIAELRARAEECSADSVRLAELAESMAFDQADELVAVEARLQVVTARIEEAAAEQQSGAVAA